MHIKKRQSLPSTARPFSKILLRLLSTMIRAGLTNHLNFSGLTQNHFYPLIFANLFKKSRLADFPGILRQPYFSA